MQSASIITDNLEFVRMICRFFADATRTTYAAIGIGLLTAFFYFKIFFGSKEGFVDDVESASASPLFNKRYDYVDIQWSKEKIWIWLLISVGCGVLAYYQLPQWFPKMFPK